MTDERIESRASGRTRENGRARKNGRTRTEEVGTNGRLDRGTTTERRVLASVAGRGAGLGTIAARLERPFGRHRGVGYAACIETVGRLEAAGFLTTIPDRDRSFGTNAAASPRHGTYAITDVGKQRLRSLAREPLRPARGLR